ncbi:GGDEF domain-containing phosphodiesterase [uncultured Sphaerochaeta sp.]|uniref:putative bifunctional diguanylate cyclase/phosphodiesterase n=1 Tax=uncultured Sphaerochaeta sp. TaxID=886478 RepID=UPI002A0A995A|nr:GGDEF domain-containing phosphodiesterase [uncultured Sphaerochaeta sp.]
MDQQDKATVILLCDENPTKQDLYKLLSENFTVIEENTVQDTLDLQQSLTEAPLVVLDLINSYDKGFSYLNARTTHAAAMKSPVLSMIHPEDRQTIEQSFALGSSNCFFFPMEPELLKTMILDILEKQQNPIQERLSFQKSYNGIAFFEYTAHYMRPIYINAMETSQKEGSSKFQDFCMKVPNAFSLFTANSQLLLEEKILEILETKDTYTLNLETGNSSQLPPSCMFQISWVPFSSSNHPVILFVVLESWEQHAKKKCMEAQLQLDPLTNLYNREAFYKEANTLIQQNRDTTYLYIRWNVVRFKIINDMFGNKTGNSVLKHIAKGFSTWVGNRGICGKFYSDQFAFCIPQTGFDPELFSSYSLALLKSTGVNLTLQMTFGVYEITDITLPVERINDRAKLAMRSIRENSAKPYCFYDAAMRDKVLSAQKITDTAENALQTDQFIIYLQPIFNINENHFVAAEALVRWVHPIEGIISPKDFIPLFEENGFIEKLDMYVLEQTCKLQRSLIDEGKRVLPISINLSRIDFFDSELCEKIIQMVDHYDLSHGLIYLEITETAYMDNPKQLLDTISILQKQGFKILMDDFGSGYSSLNTLQDVPIDILKLDMLFSRQIGISNKSETIVQSIVNMARGLNLPVIAEGIETQQQATFFKSIGCPLIQGYLFSKPLPEKEYRKRIFQEGTQIAETRQTKTIPLPMNNLLVSRYRKLLETVFITIFEVNFSQNTYTNLYADDGFTLLPFGIAGSLQEAELFVTQKLIHPDDRRQYAEQNKNTAQATKEKPGSLQTSELRLLNRNGFYCTVQRFLVKMESRTNDSVYLSLLAKKENNHLASCILEAISDLEAQRKGEQQYCIDRLQPRPLPLNGI